MWDPPKREGLVDVDPRDATYAEGQRAETVFFIRLLEAPVVRALIYFLAYELTGNSVLTDVAEVLRWTWYGNLGMRQGQRTKDCTWVSHERVGCDMLEYSTTSIGGPMMLKWRSYTEPCSCAMALEKPDLNGRRVVPDQHQYPSVVAQT